MKRQTKILTDARVRAATKPGLHADGEGLSLKVWPNGNKTWLFRKMIDGRARKMGLGTFPSVSLAAARAAARKLQTVIDEGKDPFEEKAVTKAAKAHQKANARTLLECADQYIAQTRKSGRDGRPWSAEHARQWVTTFHESKRGSKTFPALTEPLNDLPIRDITKAQVVALIEDLWSKTPVTASRVKARLESIFDWATFRDLRDGENPAAWTIEAAKLPKVPEATHLAAMPYAELPAFVAELRGRPELAAKAIELLILSATRASEAFGAQWSEIDVENRLWVIPANRMKGAKEHRIPLSDASIALLKSLPRDDDYLFPGQWRGTHLGGHAARSLLKSLRPGAAITLHGFRSAFADWSYERTGFTGHEIELSLAHSVGNKVERSYRRSDMLDRRRELMQAWAAYCGGTAAGDNIVAFRA